MRPRKYDDAEELQKVIDKYFEQITKDDYVTITGLILYAGFADRSSFYKYEDNEKFRHTIKNARLRVEQIYEKALHKGNTIGAIFALKNMGWSDKIEQDITVQSERPLYGPLSKEPYKPALVHDN